MTENGTVNGHVDGHGAADPDVPAAKKAKVGSAHAGGADTHEGVLRPGLLSPESCAALRASFDASKPYTHVVIRDLCDPQLLRQVREEIITNLSATYKETDLFKVFQTGDLANVDENDATHAAQLPGLLALRRALYSDAFRAFVRCATGCGELSDKTDCSCNTYAQGGHLLCHDDVIGTRRVSYIVYLTDPDDPWVEADGGALELYPLQDGEEHTPAVAPSTCLPPHWNSMAMFTVQPGRSFHAVQEVLAGDKPRLSISGWYHAPTAPADAANASLQQLQSGQDAVKEYAPFAGPTYGPLSDEDVAFLLRYVNPVYLSDASWPAVAARFKDDGSVQLRGFLKSTLAEQLLEGVRSRDADAALGRGALPAYCAGEGEGWAAVGPPHKQRYLRYEGAPAGDAAAAAAAGDVGGALATLREKLFGSAAFARLLRTLTTLGMAGHAGEVRRFRPGLDYTVAHYGILTKDPRLDCVLCLCDEAGGGAEEWGAGEVGGFEAYLLADEAEAEAAAVYRQDVEESGVLNVSASHNTLSLVLRDEGLMRFVKYVSAAAPGSRVDVAMEYLPEDDSDDEGGDEEGGSGEGGSGEVPSGDRADT